MVRISITQEAYDAIQKRFNEAYDKAEAAELAGTRDIEAEQERDRCFDALYEATFFDFD